MKIQNSDTKNKKSIKAEEISSIDKEQIVLGSETKAKKDKKSEEVEKKDAGSKDEKGVIGKIADEAKAAIIETKEKFESDTENLRSKNTDENKNPDYEVEKIPKGSQIVFPEGGPNVVINTESKIKKPK